MLRPSISVSNYYGEGVVIATRELRFFLACPSGRFETRRCKEIVGATCIVMEDKTKVWHVKMPELEQKDVEMSIMKPPILHWLDEEDTDLHDYLDDPTDPVRCVPGPDNELYWDIKRSYRESMYGERGSTLNFWQLSMHSERLTLGMKMHSTAAFLSVPNKDGVVLGGYSSREFNDNTARGHLAWLTLTTRQVTDVVMYDEDFLSVKGGRQVSDAEQPMDEETERESPSALCSEIFAWVSRHQGD